MKQWRMAARDAAELFFWPMLAALLPWAAGFRLIRCLARRAWFYEADARAALQIARTRLAVNDERDWITRYCFMRMMDHADLYLSLTRSRAWLEKHLIRHGAWPQQKPFIGMTFHWGGGMLALRSMQYATGPFAGVAIAQDKSAYRGRPLLYAYVRLRNFETARAIGGGLSFTGSAARKFVGALRGGVSICGLFDVPPAPNVKFRAVKFLGARALFPTGAVRLALAHRAPLVIFRCMVDPVSGKREIWIESPALDVSEAALMERAVKSLEEAVRTQPSAWHMWGVLDALEKAAEEHGGAVQP
jgi:lauroyl/myristoyl acyltransferase